jgi:hypothetical protein
MTSIGLFSQGIYNACSILRLRLVECFRPHYEITMNEIKAKNALRHSSGEKQEVVEADDLKENKKIIKPTLFFLYFNSDEAICTSKDNNFYSCHVNLLFNSVLRILDV